MAGVGFDALMMKDADSGLKDRFGRLAYLWTGARATQMKAPKMTVKVDGTVWFKGRATCLLLGNMGTLAGGLTAFPDARPDDGFLEIGVVTARGTVQWVRMLSRLATGHADRSPLARMTRGRKVDVNSPGQPLTSSTAALDPPSGPCMRTVEPGAIVVCVPEAHRR